MLGRRKLLVVRKNMDEGNIQSLVQDDFVVGAAGNILSAKEHLEQDFSADLVLADAGLLKEDNYSLIHLLKNNPDTSATPLLLIAKREEEALCLEGISQGADDFILEPYTSHELRIRIATRLELAGLRRANEKSTADTRHSLEAIFRQAPVALACVKGPEWVYSFANPMYQRIFNRTQEQLIGKPITEIFPEAGTGNFPGVFDLVTQLGETYVRYGHELQFDRRGNGSPEKAFFNFVAQPVKDEQGNVSGIMIVAFETTGQVLAAEKLQASEAEHWFLSEANKLLSSTLDYKKMLSSLAAIAVPVLSDYCFIDILNDDQKMERVAWAHKDPAMQREFVEVFRYAAPMEAKNHPVWKVLESGKPLVRPITREWLEEMAVNRNHLEFMEKLHGRAVMIFPLIFRDIKLGTLTFCKAEEGDEYGKNDKRVAGELAGRVAVAIYNSRLYEQAQVEIAKKVEAVKSLRKSERRYRNMADTVPVMIWLTGPDGKCIYLNKQWHNYTGQKGKDGLGFGWVDALHAGDRKLATENFLTANVRRAPFTYNMRLVDKNGSYRWHLASGVPRFNSRKTFEGFIGVVLDIHERKIAEEKLKDREEKLSISIEAGKVGIWEKDLVAHTTTISNELKAIFGDPFGGLNTINGDKFYKNCTHPDDVPQIISYFKKVFRNKKKEFGLEFRIIKPDSQVAWIAERGRIEYAKGKPVKMYGTCMDITQQKLLEQQKEDFLSIASHELKTPVTSIKGHIQLLEESLREEGYHWGATQLKRVDIQIDKLVVLINDLLDVTKIQAGKLEFKREVFDIDQLVDEVVKNMQFLSSSHQIIKKGISGKLVIADRSRIEQVLINLISNAVKYSPSADKIIVHTAATGKNVVLSVQDFGGGIPPEELSRVFDRFYRIKGRKFSSAGLGLGLFIAAEIIRGLNGSIWAESKLGEGSIFYITLPLGQGTISEGSKPVGNEARYAAGQPEKHSAKG